MEPYAAARIRVMRSKLIGSEGYERLLKMTDKEIVGFLQSTEYRAEVDALAIKDLEDLEAVDSIIAANSLRTVEKLKRISGKSFMRVLTSVLHDNDVWNITVVAEALVGEVDPEKTLKRFRKQGTFDPMFLANAKNVKELSELASQYLPKVSGASTFTELVHALSSSSTKKRRLNDPYLIDERNILTLIQFKREDIAADEIATHFVFGGTLGYDMLKGAASQDMNNIIQFLRKTKYKDAFETIDTNDLALMESELHRVVIKKIRTMARRKPFGPALLSNYLADKEIEYDNLRVLIKGKRLGLDEKFIREHLVV